VVTEMNTPCPNKLVVHHVLVGEKDDLKRLCQEVADSFEKKLVAPFR
jgi:hypothetical protein